MRARLPLNHDDRGRQPGADAGSGQGQERLQLRAARISGVEPQYQDIRTIELEYGRNFSWQDEEQVSRVAIVGFDMAEQLFGKRSIFGESITVNGTPHGRRQDPQEEPGQQLQRSRQQQIFVPFAAMSRDLPRKDAEPARCRTSSSRRDGSSTAAEGARRADRPDRGRRLAARTRTSARFSRAATGSTRPTAGDRDVGHLAADVDVRPHDRPHEAVLHHRRDRRCSAASA